MRHALIAALIFASLPLMFNACSAHPITALNAVVTQSRAENSVQVNFCTDPAYTQKQYVKTIIVLDHSGSNQKNYQMNSDGSGSPALVGGVPVISAAYATDPTGSLRYGSVNQAGTLLNYLGTLPANSATDPDHFFALVDFNSQVTTYPANSSGFTADTAAFYNYVLQDSKGGVGGTGAPADGDNTSYESALHSVYSIITADIQQAQNCAALPLGSASPGSWCPTPGKQVASSYSIVFMSDGSPITNISGVGVNGAGQIVVTGQITITKEPATDILALVSSIADLNANAKFVSSVNLFTVYYYVPGNVDQSGQALLANMAKAGNGIAYNALSGSSVNYSSFQPPQKRIKYQLGTVYVTNASVTYWNDGKLHADSDMDGLPDDVETAWGSNPTKYSTDGNGISDLVKYRLKNGAACAHKNGSGLCTDAVTNYKAGACAAIAVVGGKFASSDPDGLNDCEKTLLGDAAGVNNPDSNGDLIPDWLEFINAIPFQASSNPAINTVGADGYSLQQKLKLSLPLNVPASEIMNFSPANYSLNLLSSNDTQDCYQLNVNDLPQIGDGNTIRVDLIEHSPMLKTNDLYRVAKKTFAAGSSSLTFADWNDAGEIAAGTWAVWP